MIDKLACLFCNKSFTILSVIMCKSLELPDLFGLLEGAWFVCFKTLYYTNMISKGFFPLGLRHFSSFLIIFESKWIFQKVENKQYFNILRKT